MSELQPLVSILVASYNNSRYAIDTLNSIKNQTYPNIEVIIVDDASTDNSIDIISEWLNGYDKPSKLIVHKVNTGICGTCNDLVKNAKGKYISFISTDDIYLPERITSQVKILEESATSFAMVYSDVYLIDEEGSKMFGTYMLSRCKTRFTEAPSGNIIDELQEENFLHFLGALVRKNVYDLVGLYDENLKFEDYDMAIRISKQFQVIFIDNIQSLYRVHPQSFSGKTKNWNELLFPLFLKHSDLPVFKKKAEEMILNNYLHKVPGTKNMVLEYYIRTKKRLKYYFFIANDIPPLFMKIYRKLGL